jgi:glycosyltransferase involved in cell wall biosynthesis
MKIAVLGIRGFPGVQGGPETHAQNLYPLLVKRGCDVTVFTRSGYVDGSVTGYEGVKLVCLPCVRNKFLEAFLHTFAGVYAAKKISPDIVHFHAVGPSLFVPLAKMLGMKAVMTNHGPDYRRKKWNAFARAVLRLGEYAGNGWADGVICVSRWVTDDINRRFRSDVAFIPNGVRLPSGPPGDPALKKYGLARGRYVMAIGRFVPEKGFHDLIEAFGMAGIPGWKLVIVGDATHEDRYTALLKKSASGEVVFTGVLTGAPLGEIYANAGLFVLPSYYEALPIVLLEAMGHGLSCVVSDIPANREVGLPDERYFKPGDVAGIAGKLKNFAARPLAEEEKALQIKTVAGRYDWEAIADRTLEVYRKVLWRAR